MRSRDPGSVAGSRNRSHTQRTRWHEALKRPRGSRPACPSCCCSGAACMQLELFWGCPSVRPAGRRGEGPGGRAGTAADRSRRPQETDTDVKGPVTSVCLRGVRRRTASSLEDLRSGRPDHARYAA